MPCDQLCDQFRIKRGRNRAEPIDTGTVIRNNTGGEWETLPGIAMLESTTQNVSSDSILE